jgi:hypothetical protein
MRDPSWKIDAKGCACLSASSDAVIEASSSLIVEEAFLRGIMEDPAEVFKPPGQDDDFGFKYLDTLRSNIGQAEQGISRQLVLITILSAIFLLLAENQVGGISFSFVRLTKYSYVQAFLPLVIAAVYLSTVNTMQMARQLTKAHDLLMQYLRPEIVAKNYERLLYPPTGAFTAATALPYILDSGMNREATIIVGRVRYLIYIIGPVGIVIYAIYDLLTSSPGPLQYAAASLSIVIIALSTPLSASLISETFT